MSVARFPAAQGCQHAWAAGNLARTRLERTSVEPPACGVSSHGAVACRCRQCRKACRHTFLHWCSSGGIAGARQSGHDPCLAALLPAQAPPVSTGNDSVAQQPYSRPSPQRSSPLLPLLQTLQKVLAAIVAKGRLKPSVARCRKHRCFNTSYSPIWEVLVQAGSCSHSEHHESLFIP